MHNKSPGGIIQSNQSSFSTLYRLVDMVIITLVYFLVLLYQGLSINSSDLLLLFVSIISYMLCAEAVDLYRSWRTAPNTMMIKWAMIFFFQAEDGIRDAQESRGLGDVYKRQDQGRLDCRQCRY